MRADRLDAERPEHERQHVRRGRVAVVDDYPEVALADRVGVESPNEILRVRLAHARRVGDVADRVVRGAAELEAREVLLDLLLHRRGQLDPRLLEEADLDHFGIRVVDADVEAGVEALRLQQVPVDGGRKHAEVGDVDAGRVEAGDHRPLDHPAAGWSLAAADDAVAALERRAERRSKPHRDLGRDVDVDQTGEAISAPEARGGTRLPDDALRHLCAGLDLLVRVDANAGMDDALRAEGDLVADRGALLDEHVRADVAAAPQNRAFDHRAAAHVG